MKKIISWLAVFCLLLSMIPASVIAEQEEYSVSTTIGDVKFRPNESAEFTVTTYVAEGAEQKTVVGAFELYDGEGNAIENVQDVVKLEYQEYPSGIWYEFYGEFGPASGFPMTNGATSTFRATFKDEGDYLVKVSVKDVNNGRSVLCHTEQISLKVAKFVNSVLDTTLPESIYPNQDVEFTCTTTANSHAGETVLGSFAVAGVADLSKVATLKYQDSASGNWYEFYGDFGPAAGFSLSDATSNFRVNFKKAGVYNVKIFMKTLEGTELCSTEKVVTVVDAVPPVVKTATVDNENWARSKTVTVTATDAESSVANVVYSKENVYSETLPAADKQADGSYQFQVSEEGTYYIWAVDAYENRTDVKTLPVQKIDTTNPEITDIKADPNSWTNGEVTVEVVAADAASGISKVVYSTTEKYTDGLPEAKLNDKGAYQFAVDVDAFNGNYYVWAIDAVGNRSDAKTVGVKIEKVLPTVSLAVVTPEGWTNTAVTVNIKVFDNGETQSGVAKVLYSYGSEKGEATLNADGTYTFTVSKEKEYDADFSVWAVDVAGNESEVVTVKVQIDTTAPVVKSATASPAAWTNGDVIVSGTVSDVITSAGNSGVAKVLYTYGSEEGEATLNADGTYTFTVSKKNEYNGEFSVWAVDNAGNESEAVKVKVRIDTTAPVVDSAIAATKTWINGDVIVSGTVSDIITSAGNSGVAKVLYTYGSEKGEATLNADGTYTFTVSKKNEYNGEFSVWAVDAAGNESDPVKVKVQIDTTAPAVDSANADPAAWTNGNVTVSGTVSDAASKVSNSGVAKVLYSYGSEKGEATLKADGTYTFTVSGEHNGDFSVWAVDNAGNKSEEEKVKVQIDTTAPAVDTINANVEGWTNKDVVVSATVSDAASKVSNSGVAKVLYSYGSEKGEATLKADGTYTFTVSGEHNGDFSVWAVDAAGNESDPVKVMVQIDTTVPSGRISAEFYFDDDADKADHCLMAPWTDLADAEDVLNDKLWANESINIVIIETKDQGGSNVAKVEYYIDYYAADSELVFKTEQDLDSLTEWKNVKDNPIPEITTDSRFVVYLKITDNAGNYTYISTNSMIVDTHKPTGDYLNNKIDIEVTHEKEGATAEARKDPGNSDLMRAALYSKADEDPQISIEVYEPKYFGDDLATNENPEGVFSGLSKITYEIKVDGKLEDFGTLFDAETAINENGETAEEFGLTSQWIGKRTITNNSNDVVVEITAIDNAGNVARAATNLMIDVTAPEITVEYSEETPYSNATREATIYVKERNFVPFELASANALSDDLVNTIIAQFGSEVKITNWKRTEIPVEDQQPNGDHITHQITVTFEKDDHYQISALTTADAAGNPAKEVGAGDVFTIDKTDPVVKVSYNNNSAENGKYFKATRTATIEITEHNFPMDAEGNVDYERVVFTQTADRGGVIPTVTWNHKGDTHIATFNYTTDGDYTFGVDVTDLAGNECEDADANYGYTVAGKDFVVDTTYEDMITQEGVESGVAYGYDAEVIPNVKIFDINLQEYTVTLTGVQKDKTIDLTDEVNALLDKGTETVTGIFDIFETKQDMDGIYTLNMTSRDKAGNEDSMEIIFTVNRFGSVYAFEDYLMNLVKDGGSFVQKVDSDLIITEYNADKLVVDSLKIEITVDGKPLENVQYTVTPEINDTVSVGSSGWYQYKYTISKDNFAADGVYKISISSEDATGNTPENSNYEDKGMTFRVDSTQAEISSVVGLEKAIINAQEVTVKYTVFDTIGIKSIMVYVDGKPVDEITDFVADPNNYSGAFTLTESSSAQKVRIVIEDMAGNITDTDAESFAPAYEFNGSVTVSTNIFVRWYANKPLFWGSIGGVVVIAGALWFFLAGKKKKKEEAAAK